jgi:tetratricopeptide (TPR) repeat protein
MQEAAYSSLLLRHRRSYHQRVAETLEAKPELWVVRAELPAVLTYQWERAEDWGKAATWALRAADQARRAYSPKDAATMYMRAQSAATRTGDTALLRAALSGSADAALMMNDPERALADLETALTLGAEGVELGVLERRRGQAYARIGQAASALEAYARSSAAFGEPAPDEPDSLKEERACLRIQVAFAQLGRGAVDLARSAAAEVLDLHMSNGDEADALRLLGVTELLTGNIEDAVAHFEAALIIANSLGDLLRAAALTEQLGLARLELGEDAAGVDGLRQALERYRRLGDRAGAARCLDALGERALHTGDLREAIARFNEAAQEATEDAALSGRTSLLLGRVLGLTGAWDEARAALERAGADDFEIAGQAELELALLDVARGGTPEVALRAALVAAERLGRVEAAQRARLGLATLARRRGDLAAARTHLRAVLESAANPESEQAIIALAGLAHVASTEGNPGPAVAVAARALEMAERRGPATALWYARRIYGITLDGAGRHEAAERELGGVVEATRTAGALPELAAALSAWARSRRALGDPTGAADAFSELRGVAARVQGARA